MTRRQRKSDAKKKAPPIAVLEVAPDDDESKAIMIRPIVERRDDLIAGQSVAGAMSLGVVEQNRAANLIRRLYDLVEDPLLPTREFLDVVKELRGFVRIQVDLDKLNRPVLHQHAHLHAHGTTDAARHKLSEIAAKRGIPELFGRGTEARSQ